MDARRSKQQPGSATPPVPAAPAPGAPQPRVPRQPGPSWQRLSPAASGERR